MKPLWWAFCYTCRFSVLVKSRALMRSVKRKHREQTKHKGLVSYFIEKVRVIS